VSLTTGPP